MVDASIRTKDLKRSIIARGKDLGAGRTHNMGGIYQFNSTKIQIPINKTNYTPTFTLLPNGTYSIGSSLPPSELYGTVIIPSSVNGIPVTSIEDLVFSYATSITSIIIPSSVTSIGTAAFTGWSNLQSINIPTQITRIELNAFKNCSSLQSIILPPSVTFIGAGAFEGCSNLQSINFPSGLITIDPRAFKNCSKLTGTLTIVNGLPSVASDAFNNTLVTIV